MNHPFRRLHGAGGQKGNPGGQLLRDGVRVVGNLGDESDLKCALGRQPAPEEDHLLQDGFGKQPGQALCSRPTRHNSHCRLGQGHRGGSGHDTEVAGRRQFQSTTQCQPVQDRHGRFRQPGEPIEDPVPLTYPSSCELGGTEVTPTVNVGPGAECAVPLS